MDALFCKGSNLMLFPDRFFIRQIILKFLQILTKHRFSHPVYEVAVSCLCPVNFWSEELD